MTIEEARLEIFSWINWYNNQRIPRTLNYLTPQEFEEFKLEKAA
jgi:transposase InsO family protein